MTNPTAKSENSAQTPAPHAALSAATVVLVGAGPGDPGLMTVAGLAALRKADVLFYDALANPVLLDEAPPACEKINVGKRARKHLVKQDDTNQMMVDRARRVGAGGTVVRLKGGDPYLFGRGAEEAVFCAKHGVPVVVVPGVTAGIAAPAAAGIPVTHRKIASTVTIITGHEDPTKGATSVDYQGLARLIERGGTACFYMGVGRLQSICDELAACGLPRATPAALVQWGTLPKQRHVAGTLDNIRQRVEDAGLSSPAIIVVGEVAAIDEPGLDYFTNRPLFGQRVVVTRTRQQSSSLKRQLEDLGAEVLEAPTIRIAEPRAADARRLATSVEQIESYGWVILTSANAVDALAESIAGAGRDSRSLAGVRFACIGGATADRLHERLNIVADFVPSRAVSDSFIAEFPATHDLAGVRLLLPVADIAGPAIARRLRDAGADLDEVTAYRTLPVESLPDAVVEAFRAGDIDWVTFTSSSTATNLVALLGDDAPALSRCKLASIGPKTTMALADAGYPPTVEAQPHDVAGLIDALAGSVQ
ncbi:uroporphyrinogen-III C-methyltransferase [Phycisphaeraceae bacterium D3-23]